MNFSLEMAFGEFCAAVFENLGDDLH